MFLVAFIIDICYVNVLIKKVPAKYVFYFVWVGTAMVSSTKH